MPPFSTTPDPQFAFETREHQLAVTKIAYSVSERRGIFLLVGQIGTGKTTISQLLLNAWDQDALEREVRVCLNGAKVCGVVSNRATG